MHKFEQSCLEKTSLLQPLSIILCVSRLSLCVNEMGKAQGESGKKIYHVKNITGRDNSTTCR